MPLPDNIDTWAEPFRATATGIVATLEASGVTTWPWEGHELPGPLPAATCVAEDGTSGFRGAQQSFIFGESSWTVRYYTAFEAGMDPQLVWSDAYQGLAVIMSALGADQTLGGRVASVDVDRYSIGLVRTRDGDKPELMSEIFLTVRNAPY